jgi:Family of unknown function (DUF6535)
VEGSHGRHPHICTFYIVLQVPTSRGTFTWSGLFSGIVTAFNNDKALQQPDVPTASMNLTVQLVTLLAFSKNHSNPELPQLHSPNSQVSFVIIAVWFLSLVFSLALPSPRPLSTSGPACICKAHSSALTLINAHADVSAARRAEILR